nr:retrovirus-related Pol polyprotein from transposon TNT 1-94 [Tanacetum cinerariifolium]
MELITLVDLFCSFSHLKVLDMAYQGFLRVGTTFNIFQNILFPYSLNTAYYLLLDTAHRILFPLWSLGLVAEAYEWEEEEVSSDENEMVEVKVLMAIANDESGVVGKKPWLSEADRFNLPNHDTGRILSIESHVNGTNYAVIVNVTNSSVIEYDSTEESTLAIKFSKPLTYDITIAKSERYPPDEYLHHFEPSQRFQVDSNVVQFIEPHDRPKPFINEFVASSNQSYQFDQHDQTFQNDEILNDDHAERLNHTNDENINENLTLATLALQDRYARDKHTELVNIVGFLSEKKPKRSLKYLSILDGLMPCKIARLKAIRIFLAFATYMNLIVYQIDVKSVILNGKLKEEVYVQQPLSFKSSEFLNHVYKLVKSLYRVKQAPRACKTLMVPQNNLGNNLNEKAVNETQYKVEAEYIDAARCCANILWMKSWLNDYDIIYENVPIFCDNTSAIAILTNPVLHARTKHIDIRYHFIRDHIIKGDIELHFIPTQYQLDDIFTKPLNEQTFKRLIIELGPSFTAHMLDIYKDNGLKEFKAPKTIPKTKELEPEGKNPRAKTRCKKIIPMRIKNHLASKHKATFIGPLLKEAIEAPKGHSKKRK